MPKWFGGRDKGVVGSSPVELATTAGAAAASLRDMMVGEFDLPGLTRQSAWAAATEALAMLLHVIDRYAFRAAGDFARQRLLDEVTPSAVGQMMELDWSDKDDSYRAGIYTLTIERIASANKTLSQSKHLWGDDEKEFNPMRSDTALAASAQRLFAELGVKPEFWAQRKYSICLVTVVADTDLLKRTHAAAVSRR